MHKKSNRRKFFKMVSTVAAGITAFPLIGKANSIKAVDLNETGSKFDDLKITDIKIYRMEFPGKTPRKWNSIITSGGGAPAMEILELYTNQGIIGRSFPKGPKSLITGRAFSRVKGKNPFFVEKIWDDMYRENLKPIAKGMYIESIGSIDMAIWDIIGKALGLPVYKVLGAHHTKIRVYAAGGYYREDKTTADLVKEMEGYIDEGFRAVKMKVGGASFKKDIERVKAVKEAIGPDIDLLIDANNKWLPYEAIRFGKAIERFNPFWFEEPVVADDFVGCAEVRQNLDIPIVAGENEYTRWGCRDLIMAGSADILNLDTVKAGGITEYRKIANLASTFHIPVSPHGVSHMSIHLHASLSNSLIMETYPGVKSKFNPVLPLYPVKEGYITVPETPGLGIELDPKLVEKYKVN